MSHFRFNTLQSSRIAYGCIVALGTIATAGVAEIEIQGKVFSKWIVSMKETIRAGISAPPETQQQNSTVTSEQIFWPFTYVGQEVAKISQQVLPFFSGIPDTIKLFASSWKEVLGGIWSLLSNLVDRRIFTKIFDNIHIRIGNITSFFFSSGSSGGEKEKFINLFKGGKLKSTFAVIGFLLGQEIGGKYFKAKPNVFNYLLLSWMDKPKEVTKKIEKLLTTIKKLADKLKASDSSSSNGNGSNKVYELEIPLIQEYLETTEGLGETLFEIFWPLEVHAVIKNGNKGKNSQSWLKLNQFLF